MKHRKHPLESDDTTSAHPHTAAQPGERPECPPPGSQRQRCDQLRSGALSTALLALLFAAPAAHAIDEWQPLGPYGASILTLAADPTDEARWVAGGFAGLFRSTDGGATWTRADADLTSTDIGASVFAADGTLLVGTFGAGVFRSTDGGVTFAPASGGAEAATIFALLAEGDRVWAGTAADGVFVSTNGGASWEPRSNGLDGPTPGTFLQINQFLRLGDDELLVATGSTSAAGGVFRTTDGGASWEPSSSGLTNLKVSALAANPDASVLYAGTVLSGLEQSGVYRSTDSGSTWSLAVTGLTNTVISDILVDPDSPALVYTSTQTSASFTDSGVYRSTDAGSSWALVPAGPAARDVRVLARSSEGLLLAGAAGQSARRGGVFRSDDGLTWTRSDSGLAVMLCRSLASDPVDPEALWVGAVGTFRQPGGVYESLDLGDTWNENSSTGMPSSILALIAPTPEVRFAGTTSGVYRWNHDVRVWEPTALINRRVRQLLALPDEDGRLVWAATDVGVYRTTNRGNEWEDRTADLGSTDVTAIALDPQLPDTVYAGTAAAGVYVTLDGGSIWTAASDGLGSTVIRDLVIDDGGSVVAATDAGIYRLDGTTWTDISSGLSSLDVGDLSTIRDLMFAATSDGVFRAATAAPVAWEAAGIGLPDVVVNAVHADTAQGRVRVFAATEGEGVYFGDEVVPVAIASFEAAARPGEITLRFRTAFELHHLGFHVDRRLEGESLYQRRTATLLTDGPDYVFVDGDPVLTAGRAVEYRLVAVGRSGELEEHGPYRVVIPAATPSTPTVALWAAPSPFRSETMIQAPGGTGTLRIIDAAGRVVRVVAWPAGQDRWRWDGSGAGGRPLPAGSYWLELRSETGVAVQRVVRLR